MDIAGFWIYLYIASGGLMLFHLLVAATEPGYGFRLEID
jgi:hypothetical protein